MTGTNGEDKDLDHQADPLEAHSQLEDLRVIEYTPLVSPREVKLAYPLSERSIETVVAGRNAVQNLIRNPSAGNKLLIVTGPCSVHDPEAAIEYADWLRAQRDLFGDQLEIIMRLYFEKPRTTIGWKGLISDPGLDESGDINAGYMLARQLSRAITDMGVPVATELIDPDTPKYLNGTISLGIVGARNTESQGSREMASGLSYPVTFKNGTGGSVDIAAEAVITSRHPHHFKGINDDGIAARVKTTGNPDCFVTLRGGKTGPNYDEQSILNAAQVLDKAGVPPLFLVDASHANSGKNHDKQMLVIQELARQVASGSILIMGAMIESNLVAGNQPFKPGGPHEYGLSITDACSDLEETGQMLEIAAEAVDQRRLLAA